MKAIVNGKLIIKDDILENKVLLFDNRILDICEEVPVECEIIDAKGRYVSPGLIDIHIHGSCNSDTMDSTVEAINTISKGICRNGVTSFLPTTMTMEKDIIYKAFKNIRECMNTNIYGAKVIGAHMEGPFINGKYKGAQNDEYIKKPSYEFVKDFIDVIKIITYSPEMDEDFKFTKEIKKNTNITLSIGHSGASYEIAKKAINYGVTNITHLFNVMTPINHREPGVVGAALMSDAYCEIIADEVHVNKEMFKFVLNNKGTEKIVLITDSMRAGGMGDGKYDLGGQEVYVKGNDARLKSGNLAGSILNLNKSVYNFFKNTNLSINESIYMASLNPAKSIGIDNRKGSLEIGKDADISIFDEEMNCYLAISEGVKIFEK